MSDQDAQIVELVGKVEALEHVVVTLIEFLGPDLRRRMITYLTGNPVPRAVHSLQATDSLSETLSRILMDLEGVGVGDHD